MCPLSAAIDLPRLLFVLPIVIKIFPHGLFASLLPHSLLFSVVTFVSLFGRHQLSHELICTTGWITEGASVARSDRQVLQLYAGIQFTNLYMYESKETRRAYDAVAGRVNQVGEWGFEQMVKQWIHSCVGWARARQARRDGRQGRMEQGGSIDSKQSTNGVITENSG